MIIIRDKRTGKKLDFKTEAYLVRVIQYYYYSPQHVNDKKRPHKPTTIKQCCAWIQQHSETLELEKIL